MAQADAMQAPLPYALQSLIKAIDTALDMPEPKFNPQDEWAYVTTSAHRMNDMREILRAVVANPSMQTAVDASAKMGEWLTQQSLGYRPLPCEVAEGGE